MPIELPSILTKILFAAVISKSVGEPILVIPRPSIFNDPPTYKSPAMPTPPATVTAPVNELLADVVLVTAILPYNPTGSNTVIVPYIVPAALP